MKKEYNILKNMMNLNKNQKIEKNKLKKDSDFLSNFNIEIMFNSYMKSIYFGSNEVGKKNVSVNKKVNQIFLKTQVV